MHSHGHVGRGDSVQHASRVAYLTIELLHYTCACWPDSHFPHIHHRLYCVSRKKFSQAGTKHASMQSRTPRQPTSHAHHCKLKSGEGCSQVHISVVLETWLPPAQQIVAQLPKKQKNARARVRKAECSTSIFLRMVFGTPSQTLQNGSDTLKSHPNVILVCTCTQTP